MGQSIKRDDDYVTSGVCSSQVASAIDAGMVQNFNPTRIDTPREVYVLARNKGIVGRSHHYWPGAGALGDIVRHWLVQRMERDYRDVTSVAPSDSILSW